MYIRKNLFSEEQQQAKVNFAGSKENEDHIMVKLPRVIFLGAMRESVPDDIILECMVKLSSTCQHFYGLFQKDLDNFAIKKFFKAVIDDDYALVQKILNSRLDLISYEPENLTVRSQCTFQEFYAENALILAAKRNQRYMFQLLLSYCDKIKDKEVAEQIKNKGLSAWKEILMDSNKDEIVIPEDYVTYLQFIFNTIKDEKFLNNDLNENTQLVLKKLFCYLLPEKPIKLDDYIDTELFLLAAYKVFNDNHRGLSFKQQSLFIVNVIGLIQNVQPREVAIILTRGLKNYLLYQLQQDATEEKYQPPTHKMDPNTQGISYYRAFRGSQYWYGF
nr:Unknown Function [uncultured bacterium]